MDDFVPVIIMDIYQGSGSTESKVKEICRSFPVLKYQLEDDLEKFFNYTIDQLPIIKGVEVETSGNGVVHNYVMITQMPEQISAEVQKTIMRIMGYIGGFTYRKWGIGVVEEDSSFEKHLKEYLQAHPGIKPISGKKAGYPKVLEIDVREIDAARNRSYIVTEKTGLILS